MPNPNYPLSASAKVANIWNTDHALADEEAYFIATNPTAGTLIATTTSVVDDAATASATHAQNVPLALITNGWSSSDANAKRIYLKYIRLLLGQVPTSATDWQCAMRLDKNPSRYTSGGSQLAPVNVNSESSIVSKADIRFGAVVTALPTAANGRLVHRSQINSAVPVTKDQWLFTFGNPAPSMDQISGGAGAKNLCVNAGPIIIGPDWSLSLEMWGTSNAAAPSFEVEIGYAERKGGL